MSNKISASLEQNLVGAMQDIYIKTYRQLQEEREQTEEWKQTLEYSLRSTDWILDKVRQSDDYARMLYAALCNNEFIRNQTFDLLAEKTWSCSWRYAGGIIAHMRGEGDYMDWYCAGNGNEGVVTDEIAKDLLKLGWVVKY